MKILYWFLYASKKDKIKGRSLTKMIIKTGKTIDSEYFI